MITVYSIGWKQEKDEIEKKRAEWKVDCIFTQNSLSEIWRNEKTKITMFSDVYSRNSNLSICYSLLLISDRCL